MCPNVFALALVQSAYRYYSKPPYTLLVRIEAIGFPICGLLLYTAEVDTIWVHGPANLNPYGTLGGTP